MKKKVLILSGGISKERLISLDTGLQVAKELKRNGYKVKISEPDNNLEKNIKNFKPAVIFNALHGQFGEDGYIQAILERLNIPFTHSGVIASSIAMDKEISKKIFIKNKIKTPKFFTYSYDISKLELIKKIKKNHVDKDGKTIILYSSNIEEQDSYIKEANKKGYTVLLLDSPIVSHLIQKFETSKEKISFARVDSDAIDNLIKKEEKSISKLTEKEQEKLKEQIEEVIPKDKYSIQLEAMDSESLPFMITQPEFMRRMKDMQNTGGNSMFGNMPEMYNLVVNTNNKLVGEIFKTKTKNKRDRLIKQSLDLAKLSQNLLKGNDLTEFIKRSFDLIK